MSIELLPIRDIPSPDELSARGAAVITTTEPQTFLDDMFFLSGEFRASLPTKRAFPDICDAVKHGKSWEPDPLIMDERFWPRM